LICGGDCRKNVAVTSERTADGPLTGVRVIEFGQLIAGPCVGTLLGDFGADVIKIEPPGRGDALRQWGRARHNGHSLWWSVLARNKRSVALDLRDPNGQRLALELCAGADTDAVLAELQPLEEPARVAQLTGVEGIA
jgi:crotonobetainyl-CoA:carnitine CoA-transferase CaiB-like acyl-CoA transferase